MSSIDPDTAALSPPDGNPKSKFGIQKCPTHLVPPKAISEEAEVFGLGARKYGPYNWRDDAVSASVYYAAMLRHLFAWWDGEDVDAESGRTHLAHVRACAAILIDAAAHEKLNDDRYVTKKTD